MCPDYNQLPMGHLQRAQEEMRRGSSIALHGVITSWGLHGFDSLSMERQRLTDRTANNSFRPVSAVGGSSQPRITDWWCMASKIIQIHPRAHTKTHAAAPCLLADSNRWGDHWQRQKILQGKTWRHFQVCCSWVHTCLSQENKPRGWVWIKRAIKLDKYT